MGSGADDEHGARLLRWDGCVNVRDLGGLATADGRVVRPGSLVRSDSPHRLTEAGWAAAWDHGIRTVVDLRHAHERNETSDAAPRPTGITTLHIPLEDIDDADFVARWGVQLATPHYYGDAFTRFADHHAALVRAVAAAEPGGVLIHCAVGRDRTGQATLLLLTLLGVPAATIAADHALSATAAVTTIDPHHDLFEPVTPARAAEHRAAILDLIATFDPAAYLSAGGVTATEIDAVRTRLLDPAGG